MSIQQIACPACRRVLNLPADATNRLVQCPACRQSFHPAEAAPASIRAGLPASEPEPRPQPANGAPPPPAEPRRRPAPPPPAFESARSSRRKREIDDLCPRCSAFVPRGVNQCPECKAEFEEEEEFKPWEEAGLERRDSEPHRGTMLLVMGIGSILAPFLFCIPILGLITCLLGLGFGAACSVMAHRDVRRMDNHEMDRSGRGLAQGSQICAIIGVVMSLLGAVIATFITVNTLLD